MTATLATGTFPWRAFLLTITTEMVILSRSNLCTSPRPSRPAQQVGVHSGTSANVANPTTELRRFMYPEQGSFVSLPLLGQMVVRWSSQIASTLHTVDGSHWCSFPWMLWKDRNAKQMFGATKCLLWTCLPWAFVCLSLPIKYHLGNVPNKQTPFSTGCSAMALHSFSFSGIGHCCHQRLCACFPVCCRQIQLSAAQSRTASRMSGSPIPRLLERRLGLHRLRRAVSHLRGRAA
mmetsp:Transcript_26302/g.60980  ORF Transcript_26302/g.60980 Transcript_26302/m.60980 type:complete len:234 (+) Transcript_26302:422-1123(+)